MKNMRILFGVFLAILIQYTSRILSFSCGIDDEYWKNFKNDYHKTYNNCEIEVSRYKNFNNNRLMIDEHNKKYEIKKVSFNMGMNQFGDLNDKEFEDMFSPHDHNNCARLVYEDVDDEVNDEFFDDLDNAIDENEKTKIEPVLNWTAQGAVSDVVDQGACKIGWAHSAIDAVWGRLFIYSNKSTKAPKLSVKFEEKCANGQGSDGCSCGHAYNVFELARKDHGIIPYETWYEKHKSCDPTQFNWTSSYRITGGAMIKNNIVCGPDKVKKELVNGPVVVSIRAYGYSFQFAKEGIYNVEACGKEPNHEVLLVGYNFENETNPHYWIVKNSFGKSWGNNGYLNIYAFNDTDRINCSVLSNVTYPTRNAKKPKK